MTKEELFDLIVRKQVDYFSEIASSENYDEYEANYISNANYKLTENEFDELKGMESKETCKLADYPIGDSFLIFWFDEQANHGSLFFTAPEYNDNGEFKDLRFGEILEKVRKESNYKMISFTMIAEFGLRGAVYRYNKREGFFKVGYTRGYA